MHELMCESFTLWRQKTYDFLFECENVVIEEFVELFVSVVDAHCGRNICLKKLHSKLV